MPEDSQGTSEGWVKAGSRGRLGSLSTVHENYTPQLPHSEPRHFSSNPLTLIFWPAVLFGGGIIDDVEVCWKFGLGSRWRILC